jgi:hypothetical protein
VVNQNGKVPGEDRDHSLRTISEGQYVPAYNSAMDVLRDKFGRYDLGQIMEEVKDRGYTNDDLGKLAVAATLLALNEFIAPDARSEFSMLNSEEIQYAIQLASPREIAQRRSAASEVVKTYCSEQYGFEPQSVYFRHAEQIIKGVATARSEDGAMYALTDQKQIWWRTSSGEWYPFVIVRKGKDEGETVLSMAQADDLREEVGEPGRESIETVAKTGKKKEKFTDLCPIRIADYRTPRTDMQQIAEDELVLARQAQLERRVKETLRKVREIQAETAIVEEIDALSQSEIKVIRANGQEDKVLMIARSHNEISNQNLFKREVNFQSHPQFYVDHLGRIYMQLMKEKADGGFAFANLNEDGNGLIAVAQENAAYYDTGFNIAFAKHDLAAPSDHYVTFEKAQVKKSSHDRDYFVWHMLHFVPEEYKGTESVMFGVKQGETAEGYRSLPFVVKAPGEVPISTRVLPWRPGFGGRVEGVTGAVGRLLMGTESARLEIVQLTDLTKSEESRRLPERLIQLTARTKSAYPQLSSWEVRNSGIPVTAVTPDGYKFEKGRALKKITCFVRVDDPKDVNYDFLFDIDGNVYRRKKGRTPDGGEWAGVFIPHANLDKLLKS